MDEQKKQKTNKIVNIVVNVVVGVILVVALIVTINNIASKKQGYTSLFGTAYMSVQSESMSGGVMPEIEGVDMSDKLMGFEKGDVVSVKILETDEEKSSLKEGDIISFFIIQHQGGSDVRVVNSHRIVKVLKNSEGQTVYQTKGDHNDAEDPYIIYALDPGNGNYCVIGVVTGKAKGLGRIFSFFNSQTGFLICIVIPSFLVVIYCAFNLIREILRIRKANSSLDKAKYEEEIIAKLRAQGIQIPADMTAAPAPNAPAEPAEGGTSDSAETK